MREYAFPKEVSDYVLEIFGCLIPGFLFCAINFIITYMLLSITYADRIDHTFLSQLINDYRLYAPIFIFSMSYVVGHMFYRKDPKVPDTYSYKKIMRRREFEAPAERKKWIAYYEKPSSVRLVEYPYNNLKTYYQKRGLNHLVEAFQEIMKKQNRSKNWINVMKCRLRFAHPDKIRIIIKNESHIRLMSSAWYGMRYNVMLGIFYLVCLVLLVYFKGWSVDRVLANSLSLAVIAVLATVVLSVVGLLMISSFLHYMRVREITNILETAYAARIYNKDQDRELFAQL